MLISENENFFFCPRVQNEKSFLLVKEREAEKKLIDCIMRSVRNDTTTVSDAESSDECECECECECCICLTTNDDSEVIEITNLSESDSHRLCGGESADAPQAFLLMPCGAHVVCSWCIHAMATSFDLAHPIGPEHPMMRCPFPFGDGCVSQVTQTPTYIPHAAILRLLVAPDEQEQYEALVERYQFPGYELVRCPRPVLANHVTQACGAGILVPLEEIRTRPIGELVIQCDQSQDCQRKSCYHCHSLVSRLLNQCHRCVTSTENTNPRALNHYFYRTDNAGDDVLYRNDEIPIQVAVDQIVQIAQAERLEIRCFRCLTLLYKTEQCNTLTHCQMERCYSCGRTGTEQQDLGDHWDTSGIKGCPRFDHSVYWNVVAECEFRCVEGDCYSDQLGDCQIADHQPGIQKMVETRKRSHIYHAIMSLLPAMRQVVIEKTWQLVDVRPYLPECWSSDYRTYNADAVRATLDHAREIVARPDSDSDNSEIRQLARELVNKAASIVFHDFNYPTPVPQFDDAVGGDTIAPTKQRRTIVVTRKKRTIVSKPKHERLFDDFRSRYLKQR